MANYDIVGSYIDVDKYYQGKNSTASSQNATSDINIGCALNGSQKASTSSSTGDNFFKIGSSTDGFDYDKLNSLRSCENQIKELQTQLFGNGSNFFQNMLQKMGLSSNNNTNSALSGTDAVHKNLNWNSANVSATLNGRLQGVLAGKGDLVVSIAQKYNIDPVLFASIICLESGNGTSSLAKNSYNFGGIGGQGNFAHYSSVEEGLDKMASLLANNYSGSKFKTIEDVGSVYCEGGDWAGQVTSIYNTISSRC